jgi:glycosyltransferase involved in cell wall biosynthesis
MHACDAIVHTSTAPEPFGRVIVEGMLARRPVVCTDAGGPAEIVADERTGRLVPPNDPATLRMAIQDVLTDPVGAAEMTERAYATARSRFSLQQLTNNVRSVLEQTVNKSIQTADRSSSPMYASS